VKALIGFISWMSRLAFIVCLVIYISAPGTLPDPNKRDLEIVMLISGLVFAATWHIKRKQLPVEGADDDQSQAG
jgi:hypothetical protein